MLHDADVIHVNLVGGQLTDIYVHVLVHISHQNTLHIIFTWTKIIFLFSNILCNMNNTQSILQYIHTTIPIHVKCVFFQICNHSFQIPSILISFMKNTLTCIQFNGIDIGTSPKYKISPKYKTSPKYKVYSHDNEQIYRIQFHVEHSKVHNKVFCSF